MACGHGKEMWKATFIEVGDDERQGSLSPRPRSEPCSEPPSLRGAFFEADRVRVAALSQRMDEVWASNSRATMRQLLSADPVLEPLGEGHGKAGGCDRAVQYESESTGIGWGSLSECGTSDAASARETRPPATPRCDLAVAPATQRSGDAVGRRGHEKVMWKATFIEVGDDERQGSLSPRPRSEPCSEPPSLRGAFFEADRVRVAALSQRMDEVWASNSRATMRQLLSADPVLEPLGEGHGKAGGCDRAVQYESESTGIGWGSLSECGTSDAASARETRPPATPRCDLAVAPATQRSGDAVGRRGHEKVMWKATFIEVGGDERQGSLSPRPSSEPCSESASCRGEFFEADRLRASALSQHMEEAWASNDREAMRSSLQKRRMSAAADAIHLLPEQLINVVQTKAESLADSVKIDLSLVQKAIRRSGGDGDAVDVAIDQLDKIPGIIRSSFDSKIVDANEAIRTKLSAIMQKFKGRAPESQEVVTQLWTIPEELEQITWEAVDKAVQESQREAASCCDRVLRSLPEDAGSSRRALKDAKSQIVESMPEMYSATMRALRSTTNANVRHAVAYVDDPKDVPVTNHLVADVLLRAKMGTLPHTNGASLYQPSHCAASLLDCVNDAGGDGFLANHRSQCQAYDVPACFQP
ncbi:unnamed protein product [Prorocentrum cordatum]|uniref:Uncharacterized protein n=1 Tax=Prorocentrum cordatum TaxID=2364126 RepID=A0ABN9Y848_9DINO|nr:unnamed protein product [Polarella glacialis]